MVLEPTLTFTLPSLYDDTVLSCRIYHPASLAPPPAAAAPPRPSSLTSSPMSTSPSSPSFPSHALSAPHSSAVAAKTTTTTTTTTTTSNTATVKALARYHQPPGVRPVWRRQAAVVAHPYAPMGGDYDDAVVGVVAATLLRQGFLVGTFNFRGAPPSAGKTSWTAKAEVEDYMSFIGFMVYYLHHLGHPLKKYQQAQQGEADSATPTNSRHSQSAGDNPLLLIAGYSYGAVVTAMLPPLSTILQPLSEPSLGSAAAEIRLRSLHLAEQQTAAISLSLSLALASRPGTPPDPRSPVQSSPHRTLCVRVGGDEAAGQRKSHEMQSHHGHRAHKRRSQSVGGAEDTVRRSVGEFLDRTKLRKRGTNGGMTPTMPAAPAGVTEAPATIVEPVLHLVQPRTAYLLLSPLQGVIGHLLALSLPVLSLPTPHLFSKLTRRSTVPVGDQAASAPAAAAARSKTWWSSGHHHTSGPTDPAERKLVENTTLAIFGDRDRFSPISRLNEWAARLTAFEGSKFSAEPVRNAGHFWMEDGMVATVAGLVGRFAKDVTEQDRSEQGEQTGQAKQAEQAKQIKA